MKRLICFLLCGLFLTGLSACGTQNKDLIDPISFYYLRIQTPDQIHHCAEDSVIAPEIREGDGIRGDLTDLLRLYLAGPASEICETPFPSGTTLVEWSADGTTFSVVLSDEIAALSGVNLTLACACLTKTCLELGEFDAVRIQAETMTLDGKASITMDESILILVDDTVNSTETNGE